MRRLIAVFVATALAGFGQSFEVASVKLAPVTPGDLYNINLGTIRNDRLTLGNASLADCIHFAYGLTSDAQLSGPSWIKSKEIRYDIIAKTPPGTKREQALRMLQILLGERFKLELHPEQRVLSYYALLAGKGGSKIPMATDAPATLPPEAQDQLHIVSNRMLMSTVATLLSRYMHDFVVDETGMKGWFEIRLICSPDDRPIPDDQRGPSVFTAVHEQLLTIA